MEPVKLRDSKAFLIIDTAGNWPYLKTICLLSPKPAITCWKEMSGLPRLNLPAPSLP